MTSPTLQSPLVRRSLLGAACLSLQPLLLNALSVPAMAFIIRRLGAEAYAQWMAAVALLGFLAVLTNLGLRAAFIRSVAADPASAARALPEQLGLRLALSIATGSLAVALCWALGYSAVVLQCAMIGAAGLALSTMATTLSDLLQAVHRIKTLAAVSLCSGLALTAASVASAWSGGGPIAMAASYLVGPLVAVLMLSQIVRRRVCAVSVRWAPARFKQLLASSRHFAAQQVLFAGSAQAEALLSPRVIGMHSFGVFASGAMLASRLVALPDALCAAAYPVMVGACTRGRKAGSGVMLRYLVIAVTGGIAVAAACMVVAAPLGRILLPGQADAFAYIVRVTIWSIPLIGAELVMGYALNAAGKDAIQARLAVPAAGLSLAGSIALVLAWGLEGACWSMLFRPAVRAAFLAPVAFRTFLVTREPVRADVSAWRSEPLRRAG